MKRNIIRIITILFIALTSCACSKKDVLTINAFSAILKNNSFKIIDISEQYKNNEIRNAIIAQKEDYQIEYFIFNNEISAKKYLDNNVNKLASISPTKIEGNNYQKYTFNSNTHQIIISRVENTIIYVETPTKYQTETNELLKQMNY